MKYIIIAMMLGLAACAGVQQGNKSQVSISHMPNQSYASVYKLAAAHCEKYGRHAMFYQRFSPQETVFECK